MGGNPYNKSKGGFFGGRGGGGGGRGGDGGRGRGSGPNNNNGGGRGGGKGGDAAAAPGQSSDVLTTMLKLLFEKQRHTIFDSETGMLNLSKFKLCQDIASIQKSIDFNSQVFCRSLVTVIGETLGAPRFVNLSENNIRSPNFFFRAMVDSNMHLVIGGISLANNDIEALDFLAVLSKFSALQELIVTGNKIASAPTLLAQVRRRVPSLLGLNGESIQRPPLDLPLPQRAALTEMQVQILQMLEANFLNVLSQKQFDSLVTLFAPEALQSFVLVDENALNIKIRGEHKHAISDFADLKTRLRQFSRNILEHSRVKNVGVGRTRIAHYAQQGMYKKCFSVFHEIDGNANVVFLDVPVAKVPTCIVTMHGRMLWRHEKLTDKDCIACFDRTFTLTLTPQQSWQVTSDSLMLRREREEPLFFADNPSRLLVLERKLGIPAAFVKALLAGSGTDFGFQRIVTGLPTAVLEECFVLANQDVQKAAAAAQICLQRGVNAKTAIDSL